VVNEVRPGSGGIPSEVGLPSSVRARARVRVRVRVGVGVGVRVGGSAPTCALYTQRLRKLRMRRRCWSELTRISAW